MSGLAGRDLLFGGLGADTLLGGAGEDILFYGTTVLDGNRAALDELSTFWSRKDKALTFNARTAQLIAGTGSVPTFTTTNIHDDTDVDIFTGGADRDWYFAKLTDPKDQFDTLAEDVRS